MAFHATTSHTRPDPSRPEPSSRSLSRVHSIAQPVLEVSRSRLRNSNESDTHRAEPDRSAVPRTTERPLPLVSLCTLCHRLSPYRSRASCDTNFYAVTLNLATQVPLAAVHSVPTRDFESMANNSSPIRRSVLLCPRGHRNLHFTCIRSLETFAKR